MVKARGLRLQIADVGEEAAIGGRIEGALVLPVPGVDTRLERVTLREQGAVAGSEVVHDGRKTAPERRRIQPGAGQRLVLNEIMERLGDLEAACVNTVHRCNPSSS